MQQLKANHNKKLLVQYGALGLLCRATSATYSHYLDVSAGICGDFSHFIDVKWQYFAFFKMPRSRSIFNLEGCNVLYFLRNFIWLQKYPICTIWVVF